MALERIAVVLGRIDRGEENSGINNKGGGGALVHILWLLVDKWYNASASRPAQQNASFTLVFPLLQLPGVVADSKVGDGVAALEKDDLAVVGSGGVVLVLERADEVRPPRRAEPRFPLSVVVSYHSPILAAPPGEARAPGAQRLDQIVDAGRVQVAEQVRGPRVAGKVGDGAVALEEEE